ncbi:thiazole synthase [Alicyclobacillus acidoterrestris]|uniref:Thiazole synthase n=1 Tax=Alicyclobacillus acidoterrestris (strain ATCC 49025 / DSM 3922 / CIP 106132 / NCIMB 13137 / GD3B) TaxID=1356854 RepID=T0BKP6_ALIAG|nr:thiazole synthase [Alicyclobacillus acidoterrestris]EPZ41130.1 thiazole synthase [Alicyclobacillus acidoterrestris ATCC 49025]UNO47255.1 thiazole synthase [Alicyclobacillus acidoterrestris]
MDQWTIAGRTFTSRLMVGTGKYPSLTVMRDALAASGAEIVTVAVRRVNLDAREESLLAYIDLDKYFLLPNTAGCHTAEEAVRTARLARAAGLSNWVKLEVIPDDGTLLPDPVATVEAAEILVNEGFVVLPYTTDDHTVARRLLDVGCATIMPFGSAIGTGQGLPNPERLRRIIELVDGRVPVVIDAGIGAPSDASLAMELGADAVLVNTAIAKATDPVQMAQAMALGVQAGRFSYLSGRIPRTEVASPSSPEAGLIAKESAPTTARA